MKQYKIDSDICINCDTCSNTAENNFGRDEENACAIVVKQPETSKEEMECEEACNNCPVEAIQYK